MTHSAPAKLNLCLYLGPRRDDGLHELCSLFEPIDLADRIEISEAESDEIVCPGVEGENLAARALAALRKEGWESPPLRIKIEHAVQAAIKISALAQMLQSHVAHAGHEAHGDGDVE